MMLTMGSDAVGLSCVTDEVIVGDGLVGVASVSEVDTTSKDREDVPEETVGSGLDAGTVGCTMFTSPTGSICGGGESILIGKSIDATGLVTGTVTVSTLMLAFDCMSDGTLAASGTKIGGGGANGLISSVGGWNG